MKIHVGQSELPIGSIYCIGRNYKKHAEELGNDLPTQPMVFLKPAASIIGDGDVIQLPRQSKNIHHEVELVVAIGRKARNIDQNQIRDYIAGYAVGIDVTARDLQQIAKNKQHPWTVSKGFDTFAPVSRFLPFTPDTDFSSMQLKLEVNNQIRQNSSTRNMIFPVEEVLAYLSTIFTLNPGDLIFTGTPAGVSPIRSGDQIRASLNDKIKLNISVTRDYD